jgi:hypothetical protein
MIAAAKTFFAKAKEMDESILIYPWFKSSKSSKIQETRLIPETMGAFKIFFHLKHSLELLEALFI